MPTSNLQVDNFQWHFGVVEDRNDPLRLGRLRVRWYNIHNEDKTTQPTNELPWAVPIWSPDNSSNSGIGGPWTGILEGSCVIGFFIDSGFQKPFILGTIAGIPVDIPDKSKGFNDPFGTYPKHDGVDKGVNQLEESDLSRLSRKPELHISLKNRKQTRITDIPKATAASVESVLEDKEAKSYEREFWHQPHPGLDKTNADPEEKAPSSFSEYPYNHVKESESGHIFEIDDTPGHARLNKYHKSGTFEEIVDDGTRTLKVVGDNYQIVIGDENVYIHGDVNLTIDGDVRTLIKGDKYEEIDGDLFQTIRGDKITKIVGNEIKEIITDSNIQINGNDYKRVSKDKAESVIGEVSHSYASSFTESIMGKNIININDNKTEIINGSYNCLTKLNINFASSTNLNIASGSKMNIKSIGDMTIKNDVSIEGISTADDHNSSGISGANHKHISSREGTETSGPQ